MNFWTSAEGVSYPTKQQLILGIRRTFLTARFAQLVISDNNQKVQAFVPIRHNFNSFSNHLVCIVYLAKIRIH